MAQGNSGQLSNEQLALLDSLMYIDGGNGVTGISDSDNKDKTLGEYLSRIVIN